MPVTVTAAGSARRAAEPIAGVGPGCDVAVEDAAARTGARDLEGIVGGEAELLEQGAGPRRDRAGRRARGAASPPPGAGRRARDGGARRLGATAAPPPWPM